MPKQGKNMTLWNENLGELSLDTAENFLRLTGCSYSENVAIVCPLMACTGSCTYGQVKTFIFVNCRDWDILLLEQILT